MMCGSGTAVVALVAVATSALALHATAREARAFVDLSGGRRATFVDKANPKLDVARFSFSRDTAISGTVDPRCPTTSRLRFVTSSGSHAELALDCAAWKALAAGGYRYSAKTGPVRTVVYKPRTLTAKVQGPPYSDDPVAGPITFVETRLAIGATEYCGRFQSFATSSPARTVAIGPTFPCQAACGNGALEGAEECDDGNVAAGDGCRADCTLEACGDGILDASEACDDGNLSPGDCCGATCAFESAGSACAADANPCTDDVCSGAGACIHPNNAASCDDGSTCSIGDVCAGGACGGTLVPPWINELDYDDFAEFWATSANPFHDNDEFVEIAGPAGTDLGGYQVIAVEGNSTCVWTTFTGVTNGNALFTAVIPSGTVLGNDTGTGIGFLTVCFSETSTRHESNGDCDVVLPAPAVDSNLQNGFILNDDGFTCPDGVLLLDAGGAFVDALSVEGVIPPVGNFGPLFQNPPYSAGRDFGFKTGVSLEKTSSTLARATSAAEWRLTGGCTTANNDDAACIELSDSPGAANPGQLMTCGDFFCGDGLASGSEECDEGANNSNAPDASCRLDCTAQRCGDGVVDPTARPGWTEECEEDADCGGGESCFACRCGSGPPLGEIDLSVVPGPADLVMTDDGQSSWLRVTPIIIGINSGTNGQFTPGPLAFGAGSPDASGIAPFLLAAPVTISAPLPAAAGTGKVCFRLTPDPDRLGRIDCDGGSNLDVSLSIDSNGADPEGAPSFSAAAGGGDSGPGAALAYVHLEAAQPDAATACEDATYAPPLAIAITTATATTTVTELLQDGGTSVVTLTGQPFDCGNWVENAGASVVLPNLNLDLFIAQLNQSFDVGQVLRLNDD